MADEYSGYGPCLFLFDGYADGVEEPALSWFTGLLLDSISASDPEGTVSTELRGGLQQLSDLASHVTAVSRGLNKSSHTQSHDMNLYRLLLWDISHSLSVGNTAPNYRTIMNVLGKGREECLALSDLNQEVRNSCDLMLRQTPGYLGCCPIDLGNPIQRRAFFDGLMHLALIEAGTVIQERSIEGDEDCELSGARQFKPNGLTWTNCRFGTLPKRFRLPTVPISERGSLSLDRFNRKSRVSIEGRVFEALRDASWTDNTGQVFSFSAAEPGRDILEAILPDGKFTKYLFNRDHKDGGPKARFLMDVLGFEAEDWRYLAAQVYDALLLSQPKDVELKKWDKGYGARFNVYVEVTSRTGKSGVLRTGWMLTPGEIPCLSTAVPDHGDDVIKPPLPAVLKPEKASDKWWEKLFLLADENGRKAHDAVLPTPMVLVGFEVIEEGECGSAYVVVNDARKGFARWLIKTGRGDRFYRGGASVHCRSQSQSVERAQAYALAFARVLALNGVPSQVETYSS
ncbi:hypothetical protein FB480_102173 [Agrobacterium vitis]|nr:hypothetical protein FB480_102173 [Agrobacterium vitis]